MKRILVVDDEPYVIRVIRLALERHGESFSCPFLILAHVERHVESLTVCRDAVEIDEAKLR